MKLSNNFFLSCKESRIENPRSYYGCFYIGPFNSSQSLTVANSLRRMLLSETSGIAITAFEIEDASHEYCTVPGIRESVLDIMLNLKQIIFRTNEKLKKPHYGYIKVRGPGIVRSADIKLPPSIQRVDPDQYIATLSENGVFNAKITLNEGVYYKELTSQITQMNINQNLTVNISSLRSKTELLNIENLNKSKTLIPIDATFMPINKVNYMIETFGSREILQSNHVVILEIWTNGSITPRNALLNSIYNLSNLYSNLEKMQTVNQFFDPFQRQVDENYQEVFKKVSYDLQTLALRHQ